MHPYVQIRTDGVCVSYSATRPSVDSRLEICHCHEVYEILYVVRGVGRYVVEGDEYTMSEGTLMLIPPMKYHYVKVELGELYERYVLQFTRSALMPEAAELLDAMCDGCTTGAGIFYPASAVTPMLMASFERLSTVQQLPPQQSTVYVKMLLSEIVLHLSTAPAQEKRRADTEELGARVLRYLNDHLDRDECLDDLARRFFVSKYYLCRAFKKHNGTSIHTYITHKRVLYAKRLIEEGESASSAAYRVGFGDYSAFYRAYVKLVGKAPTASLKTKEEEQHEEQEPIA